jgi:molybdate transport system permease protein
VRLFHRLSRGAHLLLERLRGLPARNFVGAISAVALVFLALPVIVLAARARPATPAASMLSAMGLSLTTTLLSLVIIVLLGTPLAYTFARYRFPLKRLLNVLVEMPIVMPPVVAGLALLVTFGRRGLLGPPLETLGITLPFSTAAVIMAQVFVSAPFYIRAAQVRFQAVPRELEHAASIDGANSWQVFRHITLPMSSRGLLAGMVLSWSRALGEFGATILFAGNLQGHTQTMPLLVYNVLERDVNTAIWVGVILLVMAAAALSIMRWLARVAGDADPMAEA